MKPRTMSLAAAAIVLAAVLAPPANAANWWQRAKDFFAGDSATPETHSSDPVATDDITAALKQALSAGADQVVATLGRENGFYQVPKAHIALPKSLQKADAMLERFGAGALGDDLELRLNRAAEAAVPKAKALFADAIRQMTIDDAKAILTGPDNAATLYFQDKMTAPLATSMRPIIDDALADAGAMQAYDQLIGQYKDLPFVPDIKANLTNHVLELTIAAVFLRLGQEEAAIRNDPAKQTTALLRKVFGG